MYCFKNVSNAHCSLRMKDDATEDAIKIKSLFLPRLPPPRFRTFILIHLYLFSPQLLEVCMWRYSLRKSLCTHQVDFEGIFPKGQRIPYLQQAILKLNCSFKSIEQGKRRKIVVH